MKSSPTVDKSRSWIFPLSCERSGPLRTDSVLFFSTRTNIHRHSHFRSMVTEIWSYASPFFYSSCQVDALPYTELSGLSSLLIDPYAPLDVPKQMENPYYKEAQCTFVMSGIRFILEFSILLRLGCEAFVPHSLLLSPYTRSVASRG